MILSTWRPKTEKQNNKQIIIYYELSNDNEIYEKGSSNLRIVYKCDNLNCKTPNKKYSIGRHHLSEKRSKTVNENIQICRVCQTSGINNPRYGDNRTWDEIMGIEKSNIMKKIYSEKMMGDNNISKKEYVNENRRKNNLEKYGFENVFQIEDIKKKIEETNLHKYGKQSFTQTEDYKVKTIKTSLEKYGKQSFTQTEEYKLKIKKTSLEKYGTEHHTQSEELKANKKRNSLEKYGVDNHTKSDEYRKDRFIITNDINYIKYISDNISLFRCDKGHNFEIKSDNYLDRIKSNISICTICNPIGEQKSIKERELFEFISDNYNLEIIQSYRDKLEVDIYLPELKLGFEFNGLYYHSDKFRDNNYHLNKTNYFKNKNITIIHIWEDDWTLKRDIIKSQINNILNNNSRKIFARKCYIREIYDSRIVTEFLNENHIQGKVNSSLKLGLYYDGELISIMTFDHNEGRKRMNNNEWNLSRFCSLLNTNVIGGASKLLTYFIKNYDVSRIVSYADKDWSIGKLYKTLGFDKVSESSPDYKYIVDNQRVHKSRYTKSKLNTKLTESKQMKLNNINRIYDCGKIKFQININK